MGMSKFLKTSILGLVGTALIFIASSLRAQQASISCNGLLNQKQVIQLLQGGVADARVQSFVSKCGVDFALTQDVESRLREAGASDSLIKLAQAYSAAERQKKEQETDRLKQAAIEEQK